MHTNGLILHMQRQWIDSSVLASVGYDRGALTLEVEFKSGEVYRYANVPFSVVEQLMLASSHGRYFSKQIRNRFRARKVEANHG